jgi:serine/threonine-protein kinase
MCSPRDGEQRLSVRSFASGASVLRDRFRLVHPLGEGGMGVVWEAIDVTTRERRALKFLKDDKQSPVVEKRFLREAESANAIRHPNILHIDEVVFDDDGTPVFVMELLEGESLAGRLAREGTLTVGQTSAILRHVASALAAAHSARVVHRDLKPDNVFICRERDHSIGIRVLDFGIARKFDLPTEKLTLTGTLVGTPHYMSPEQAAGERDVDPRSDVWSFAVIAFECFTGTTPVTADNYGQLLASLIRKDIRRLSDTGLTIPDEVRQAIDACLVDREQRSADLAPVRAVLERYADTTIVAPPIRPSRVGEAVITPAALTMQQGSVDSTGKTMLMSARDTSLAPRASGAQRSLRIAASVGFAVLVAIGIAAATLRLRAGSAAHPVVASTHEPVAAPPEPSVAPATVPPASASASASAVPAMVGSTAKPHNVSTPVRSVPSPGAPRPFSSNNGPVRLQGGVAGDVPF